MSSETERSSTGGKILAVTGLVSTIGLGYLGSKWWNGEDLGWILEPFGLGANASPIVDLPKKKESFTHPKPLYINTPAPPPPSPRSKNEDKKENFIPPLPPPIQLNNSSNEQKRKIEEEKPKVIQEDPIEIKPLIFPIDDQPFEKSVEETVQKSETLEDKNVRSDRVATAESSSCEIEELREKLEREKLAALSLQAEVYAETLDRQRESARKEGERKATHTAQLAASESLLDMRAKYTRAMAALAAMEQGLSERASSEAEACRLRRLWSISNSLYMLINHEDPLSEGSTMQLDKDSLIREFGRDCLVKELIQSLPDSIGNYEELRHRFYKRVESSCRSVALIEDGEPINIWKLLLGKIELAFVSRCAGGNVKDGGPHAILDQTGELLRKGDLLNAVATLNSIQGLPHEVASDWLSEARQLLEANQILQALMHHASSKQC